MQIGRTAARQPPLPQPRRQRVCERLPAGSALDVADHGVQWIDYDRDGALDLSVTRGYTDTGGHVLFHNDIAKAAARCSLSVRVLDSAAHFTRIGAEVRLYNAAGTIRPTQRRTLAVMQVSAGSQSFNSVNMRRILGR